MKLVSCQVDDEKTISPLSRPFVYIWCCICAYLMNWANTCFWGCVCPTLWIGFNTSPQFMGQMVTNQWHEPKMHPRGLILFHLGDRVVREGDWGFLGIWCSQMYSIWLSPSAQWLFIMFSICSSSSQFVPNRSTLHPICFAQSFSSCKLWR
jgi:hypothetical protein